jgi:hypothetical protein
MRTEKDYTIFTDEIFDREAVQSNNSMYMTLPKFDGHFIYTIVRGIATMNDLPLYWIDVREGSDITQSTVLINSNTINDYLTSVIMEGFEWLQI